MNPSSGRTRGETSDHLSETEAGREVAYIGLGSNLASAWGDSLNVLRAASERLGELGRIVASSSFYLTEPVGMQNQPPFVNAVVALCPQLEPLPLLEGLLNIERQFGRDRSSSIPNGPRILDLDLLLFGQRIVSGSQLTLPHPRIEKRRFVLQPLSEIASGLRPPGSGSTIEELLKLLPDEGENRPSAVRKLELKSS